MSLTAACLFLSSLAAACSSASDPTASSPADQSSSAIDQPSASSTGERTPSNAAIVPDDPVDDYASERPTSGTGTYDTNLSDFTLTVKDIRVKYEPVEKNSDGTYESELDITFTDRAGACADYTAQINRRATKKMKLEIEGRGATAEEAAIRPGTYQLDEYNGVLDVDRYVLDDQCFISDEKPLPFSSAAATIKTVTITSITSTHVKGSYELRASDGKYIKGVFDADICPTVASATPFTCLD